MSSKQTTRRSKIDVVDYYLPIALAKLQAEVARDLLRYPDRDDPSFHSVRNAMHSIQNVAKARLSDIYNDRMDPWRGAYNLVKPYQELDETSMAAIRKEAESLRRWVNQTNAKIFGRRPFTVDELKWSGPKDSMLGKAIKAAIDTLKYTYQARLDLRFVVDSGILERKKHGSWYGNTYDVDADFYVLTEYFRILSYHAWMALLMFGGMAGGDIAKNAIAAAAREYAGVDDNPDDMIKTGIMHYLNVGFRLPGITIVEEEEQFRKEMAEAIKNLE